jgi:hypothetical protein
MRAPLEATLTVYHHIVPFYICCVIVLVQYLLYFLTLRCTLYIHEYNIIIHFQEMKTFINLLNYGVATRSPLLNGSRDTCLDNSVCPHRHTRSLVGTRHRRAHH